MDNNDNKDLVVQGVSEKILTMELSTEKYNRPDTEIIIPTDYLEILNETFRGYKKWVNENKKYIEQAKVATTEKEKETFQAKATIHFKERYAGVVAKDDFTRLSVSQIKSIWKEFMKDYRDFFHAHTNMTMEDLLRVGVDKFIYVMGWQQPSDAKKWRNNKIRVGICCHCRDQFIPMIFQSNHGLCANCRGSYSTKAMRNFILQRLNVEKRYEEAHHDMLMDFYIMFYHDELFRRFFLAGTGSALYLESLEEVVPEWAKRKEGYEEFVEGEIVE